jgi:twitching motility two-component system response regulator PilH
LTWVTGQGTFAISPFLKKDASLARKILLADDSVTAQNMGRKILNDAGYDVVTVNNGSAALKRVSELKPDVVVLDIYMPGYGGLEVCQRLKDSPETARIPVLLTVGKLEPFKPDEARRVRADAYIIKPFEATELLSALTRLEDRIVPEQEESDTSWKSRLRFPSKKKKEEPEPEIETAGVTNIRNPQRGKSKTQSPTPVAAPAVPELTVVPDIPHDITPEELDVLSALAAKLDGPAAEEKVPPAGEKSAPLEPDANCAEGPPAGEEDTTVEVAAISAEPEAERETRTPNELSGANAERNAAGPAAGSEVELTEAVHVETLVDEPAPVDQNDEPVFAVAASAALPREENTELKEVPAASSEAASAAHWSEMIASDPKAEPQKSDEPPAEGATEVVEMSKAQESPRAGATPKVEATPKLEEMVPAVPATKALEERDLGPAPSDAELAEALRLLTPELGHTDPSSRPELAHLVAAGAALPEQAALDTSETPRWVAASVAVSEDEAALSLETEMFRTLAGVTVDNLPAPDATAAAVPAPGGSADAIELDAGSVEESPAGKMAEGPSGGELTVAGGQAERNDLAWEQEAEEPAMATFADAMQPEVEVVLVSPAAAAASDITVSVEKVAPLGVETMDVPTSAAEAEGVETMAKERTKAGKSTWHQIRSGATTAAASDDAVEVAHQAVPSVEEAPRAMAAAAAAECAGASAVSPDSDTIASIVDSVLADLRPKIVAEIAKKLAGK